MPPQDANPTPSFGGFGLMLVCPNDGRHIRAFVSDREFVADVIGRVGGPLGAQSVEEGPRGRTGPGDDQEGAGVRP